MTTPWPKTRCEALTASGEACKSWAMHGESRCATHMRLAGKPPLLTPEVHDRIVSLVRMGNYVASAVVAAGIGRSTFYEWWNRGDPARTDPVNERYREFRFEVEKARAVGEAVLVGVIASEAKARTWQAAVWLLERQYPERWARASQRELVDSEAAVKDAEFDPFSEFDELAAARQKKLAGE